jgi:hypothetical protein
LECIVWSQEGTQSAASVFCLVWLVNDCLASRPQSNLAESMYLVPTKFCELDTVVRNELMDLAVLVALALRVADENDHLHGCVNRAQQGIL